MKPLLQVWPDDLAARYRAAGYWTGQTFPDLLRASATRWSTRIAIVDGKRRWTYAELLQKAETMAAGFLALGLVPGDRVVVQLPNIAEFFAIVFGLFRAGLVPVYALPAHRLTEIAHFATKAEAAAYVCADRHGGFDYRVLARQLQQAIPGIRHVVVVGEAEEFISPAGFVPLPDLPAETLSASDVAFLQISGGSTGLSKLIPRTHDDYLYSVRESARICGLKETSIYLAALPVAHNFPMSSPGFLGVLWAGGSVVLAPAPGPEIAFPLIEREQVTITGLVPPLALLWLQARKTRRENLDSLEILQVGGAKFTAEAARRVAPELGCRLQQVFGMAEGLVNYTRLDDPDDLVVETQGRPISPHDEILIVDDDDRPVPEGQPGHLLTRGPYTIRAYHNDEAANRRAFTADGFYRTGDVVTRDARGYLTVQGRANDHINRAGEKISAEEIEDHLLAHEQVFDAVVVSIPDPLLGECSCAFVIPEGEPPRAAALKAWMRSRHLADFKVPDLIVFVSAFETTAVGKISRRQLRARLRAGYLASQQTTEEKA